MLIHVRNEKELRNQKFWKEYSVADSFSPILRLKQFCFKIADYQLFTK